MVDTIQTKEGAVAISAENVRSSMRSVRRGKTKMILTPASLASHVHKQLEDKPRECSQLVVCPTGAHRAGVWAVFDTESERLKTKNRIRFSDTIKSVRNQRCNTIEHFELFDGETGKMA